jgi:hypothetical protein
VSGTRTRPAFALASAAVVALALASLVRPNGGGGSSFEPAARVIDRAFLCTPTALSNGSRELTFDAVPVSATERFAQDPSPGFIGVRSGGWGPAYDLLSIRAHRWQRFGRTTTSWQGVYANTARCASSRRSVPLSPKGLPGPPIQWQERERCVVPGRVLVRFRAALQSPALWRRISPSHVGARSNVVGAALALRSERTGNPIAYMELDRAGKTKLWYSPPACT